eukprot:TRINITY_DN2925_c0_g1::TRINITY_DN2925_c0_g1_i6::g.4070::m.4070 TRINITY_DN2925_c0_g1::TRINITY_DN2925_c0_g1_i6::g.4070  ORF type:complete len:128 (+),score=10.09 TRINITY_DN2925_c0_g1_i6:57-440(+)
MPGVGCVSQGMKFFEETPWEMAMIHVLMLLAVNFLGIIMGFVVVGVLDYYKSVARFWCEFNPYTSGCAFLGPTTHMLCQGSFPWSTAYQHAPNFVVVQVLPRCELQQIYTHLGLYYILHGFLSLPPW